jgi:hypothetical protein
MNPGFWVIPNRLNQNNDENNKARIFPHGTFSLAAKNDIYHLNPSFIKRHKNHNLYTANVITENINVNCILNRSVFNSSLNREINMLNFLLNLNDVNLENDINALQLEQQNETGTTETFHGRYLDLIAQNVNIHKHFSKALFHVPFIENLRNANYNINDTITMFGLSPRLIALQANEETVLELINYANGNSKSGRAPKVVLQYDHKYYPNNNLTS